MKNYVCESLGDYLNKDKKINESNSEDLAFDISQAVYTLINGDDVDYEPDEDVNDEINVELQSICDLSLDDLEDEDVVNGLSYDKLLCIKDVLVKHDMMNESLDKKKLKKLNEGVSKSFEEAMLKLDNVISKDDELHDIYSSILGDDTSNNEKIIKIEQFLENAENLEILNYYLPNKSNLRDLAEYIVNTEMEYVNES